MPARFARVGRIAVLLGVLVLLASIGPEASAVSTHAGNRATFLRICVTESPDPAATVAQATADIAAAAAVWDAEPSWDGSDVVNLVVSCSGTVDVTVVVEPLTAGLAVFDGTFIKFNENADWCVAADGPCNQGTEYSVIGFAVHEIGHAIGGGHAGGQEWNGLTGPNYADRDPSMTALTSQVGSYYWEDLTKDDRGMAAWVDTGGVELFWSADPGFERGKLGAWNADPAVSVTTANQHGGLWAALLPSRNDRLWVNMTYDPWNVRVVDNVQITDLYPGMVQSPVPTISANYRDVGQSPGGVRIRYKYRWLDYDTTADAKDGGVVQPWSIATTTVGSCTSTSPSGSYLPCAKTIPQIILGKDLPGSDPINNAAIVRSLFKSKSQVSLRLDEAGIRGW